MRDSTAPAPFATISCHNFTMMPAATPSRGLPAHPAQHPSAGGRPATRLARAGLAALLACALLPAAGLAGNLYKFQDKDGNVLLTNQVDSNRKPLRDGKQYRKLVKVTWYADTNVHKYGNWGSSEASVKPSMSRNRNAFDELIRAAAVRHNLDFGLVKAVIHTESGFDPRARSGPGAQGLMQLMPATAARYRVQDVWDPAQNIEAGSRHLRHLLNRYNDLSLALAAYNAGEGNVKKYGGIPPFAETRDYVERVTGRFNRLYAGDPGGPAGGTSGGATALAATTAPADALPAP